MTETPAWPKKQVYQHAAHKKRVSWWDYFNVPDRTSAVFRKLGIKRRRRDFVQLDKNVREVVSVRWSFKSLQSRNRTERMIMVLANEPEQLAAFESVRRLSGSRKAAEWLLDLLIKRDRHEEGMVRAEDNIRAAQREGVKRAMLKREKSARAQLKLHEAKLRREQKLVKKWRSKVAYYDKKRRDG